MLDIEEFSRRYNNTWIRYRAKENEAFSPAQIVACDMIDGEIYLEVLDLGRIVLRYTPKNFNTLLDLDTPETGYFNHNGYALVLFKTPARQWLRGFCNTNHEIYNPLKVIINDVYRPMFGKSLVRSIYERTFIKDNLEDTLKKCDSFAISKHVMICKSPVKSKNPVVWYDTNPVGFLQDGRIKVKDETFEQELRDELIRMDKPEWIS